MRGAEEAHQHFIDETAIGGNEGAESEGVALALTERCALLGAKEGFGEGDGRRSGDADNADGAAGSGGDGADGGGGVLHGVKEFGG